MSVSQEDLNYILNAIKAQSQDIADLETVTTTDGLTSLPAARGDKLVRIPINLLTRTEDIVVYTEIQ